MRVRFPSPRQVARAAHLAMAGLFAVACSRPGATAPGASNGTVRRIVLDGEFDDWRGLVPASRRPDGASAAAEAELLAVTQHSDGQYVYLQLDLAHAANLLGLRGTLTIAVDADGDGATGRVVDGMPGADFAVDLSPAGANGRITDGVMVRTVGKSGAERVVDSYPLEFAMQPSYEAARFELRMARGRLLGDSTGARTFSGGSYRAQIVAHDASGAIANRLPAFTGQLGPLDSTRPYATTDPLARAPRTDFRALVWNVANEGIAERPDHFRRVIRAVSPDLIILNETGGSIGRARVGAFLETVGGQWNFTYGAAGGYQRTVIASRSSVTEFPELRFIEFPDSAVRPWLALVPEANQQKERDSLHNGLATGGALVTIAGHRLAAFGVDLQSAGNRRGSWQDIRRVQEARLIREHALAAIRAHGPIDGVIQAGDHNLVGTRDALDTLATIGSGFDGNPLSHARLLQLDGRSSATWDGSSGRFPPGRLDWFNYSAAGLQVLAGFVFDVADLSDEQRRAHGLEADDSRRSSDHRPLVVDLRWRR